MARAARSALSVVRDALGVAWPLDRPLLASDVTFEHAPPPKQAPAPALVLVLAIEELPNGEMVASGKHPFESAVIFTTRVVTIR